MKARAFAIPELMLIVGTRVALGVGMAFLLGDRLSPGARRGAGWALTAVGVVSTLPLLIDVLGKPPLDPQLDRSAR